MDNEGWFHQYILGSVPYLIGTALGGAIAIGIALVVLRRQALQRSEIETQSAQLRIQEDREERSRATADDLLHLLFGLTDALPSVIEYRAFMAMGGRRAAVTNLGMGHERYAKAMKEVREFESTKVHRITNERLRDRFHDLAELLTAIAAATPDAPANREVLDAEAYISWLSDSIREYLGSRDLPADEAVPDINRDPNDYASWRPQHWELTKDPDAQPKSVRTWKWGSELPATADANVAAEDEG